MLSQRLKMVRTSLRKSQKAFATELGLSLSGLQGYEAGTFAPGCSVLEALGRIGVDLNWLLLGEGSMWRAGCEPGELVSGEDGEQRRELKLRELPAVKRPVPDNIQQMTLHEHDDAWRRLEFGRVALLASQGRQELAWQILSALVSNYPRGFSVKELMKVLQARGLTVTPRDVAANLVTLVMQGEAVEETRADDVVYRASRPHARLLMSNVGDRSQALEKAVETLIRDIHPAVENRPQSGPAPGRLMNILLNLPRGRGVSFVRTLTDAVAQMCIEAGREEGDEGVVVVIGAAPTAKTP